MDYNLNYISQSFDDETRKASQRKYLSEGTLSCKCYHNAFVFTSYDSSNILVSGGVSDKNGLFVNNSTNEDLKPINISLSDIEIENVEVIYLGYLIPVWGHMFTDGLKKSWFLFTEEGCRLIKNGAKIVYITQFNKDLPDYALKILELAGIETTSIEKIDRLRRFTKIYVPDSSIVLKDGVRFYYKEFAESIARIRLKIPSIEKYKKVYLTRSSLPSNGREYGEKAIERVFKKEGFVVISPEKLSVEDQIGLMKGCEVVASTEGSISHSFVFCNSMTKVIIVRKAEYINTYQFLINELANLNVTIIDAHKSFQCNKQNPWMGPFYLTVNSKLEAFFGHRILRWPLFLTPSWWWYSNIDSELFHKINKYRNKLVSLFLSK